MTTNEVPPGFWSRSIATVTMCIVIGAVVGAIGGVLTDNVGRGIAIGIGVAAAIAVVVLLQGEARVKRD